MASRKEYEMLFKLSAQLGGNFNGTFSKAQQTLGKMQTKLQGMNKLQHNISAYQKQQKALDDTRHKFETLQKQYDNIQKEMSETEKYSSSLSNKLLQKQLQIEKTSDTLASHEAKLKSTGSALKEAGVDTGNLAGESKRLESEYQSLKTEQEKVADGFANSAEGADEFKDSGVSSVGAIKEAMAAAGITVTLKEIYDGLVACASASIAFESGMVGIDKTTNLTAEELAEMSNTVKGLSTDIPVTTDELAQVGETAGQLGIAKDNLVEFTTVMSELGTATTMTANDGATMLAQFANITRMDPALYENLGSTVVALGNECATTEQKITEMSQGIAASGSIANMSEADIMGISAAVTSVGVEAGMGSTAVSKLIVMGIKAAETGEGLEEMANAAGVSAKEFKTAWGDDAAGALQTFISGLGNAEQRGESTMGLLNDLGITEARMQRVVLSLAQSGDLLTNSISTANTAWEENTALQTEAEKRYATTESLLTMLSSSFNNVKIELGDVLAPEIRGVAEITTDVLSDVAVFIDKNPGLIKAITIFAATVGTVTVALTAYAAAAKIAAGATALLTSAIPGVKVIMGITAGVGALAGVIAAVASAADKAKTEYDGLTASSQHNYDALQELNAEYEKACRLYGENSYEAWELQEQVNELTEEYESSKEFVEEFNAEIEALNDSISETTQKHDEAIGSIDDETESSIALIQKLEEMSSKTTITAAEQAAMSAIIEELNTRYSDMDLAIDSATGKLNLSADAIKAVAKAEADRKARQADYDAYIEILQLTADKEEQLAKASEDAAIAEQKHKEAVDAYGVGNVANWQAHSVNWATQQLNAHQAEKKAVKDAAKEYENYLETQSELQSQYDDLIGQQSELEEALGISADATDNAADANGNLAAEITSATEQAKDLGEAYQTAYDTAYKSIDGQMGLFEKVAPTAQTSIDEMIAALQSQVDYMAEYGANIQEAAKLGLSEGILEELSDGSTASAGYLAAIVADGGESIAKLNAKFKESKKGTGKLAENIAEANTNFSEKMDELETELTTTIGEMDMSTEAAESGKQTIQGFVDGANSKLEAVKTAYREIAEAAKDAIDEELDIHSPSRVTAWSGEMTGLGFIEGIISKKAEAHESMRELGRYAAEGLSADTTYVGVSPYLMAAAYQREPSEAMPFSAHTATVEGQIPKIEVNVTYHIDGNKDVTEQLHKHDADLKEVIREVIEETRVDADRGRFN